MRQTREEYVAAARWRRAEAQEMRAQGVPVREIARVLTVSVREVYRLRRAARAELRIDRCAGFARSIRLCGRPGCGAGWFAGR